jgi:formylglycine-generating enzyme required for sulfatase activity
VTAVTAYEGSPVNKIIQLSWVVLLVACASRVPEEIIDSQGAVLRLVPAGEFTIGSDTDKDSSKSAHIIYLDAFYMDVYEVTNSQYEACVAAGACERPHFERTDFRPHYFGNPEYADFR